MSAAIRLQADRDGGPLTSSTYMTMTCGAKVSLGRPVLLFSLLKQAADLRAEP